MVASTSSALFSPLKVGNVTLQHRIVMAPLTRFRGDGDHIPTEMMVEYYSQRASTPGTLIVSEATFIAPQAVGYEHVPGIWNEAQIEGWKKVTDAVHEHGSFIFLQLWAHGRAASPKVLAKEGARAGLSEPFPLVSASNIPLSDAEHKDFPPRPLTVKEIDEYVELYAKAAENAITAGFDGVEVHGANGYLLDQFLQDVSNKRRDGYGGSIENRAKFTLRVVDEVAARVGPQRTGLRISPWNDYQDMRMKDPVPTFSYLASELKKRQPGLAYLHAVEDHLKIKSNDFLRKIWQPNGGVFLSAGGHNRESAFKFAEEKGDVVVFGKMFISNPDLPRRIEKDIPFTKYDYTTFYTWMSERGYTSYSFAPEDSDAQAAHL